MFGSCSHSARSASFKFVEDFRKGGPRLPTVTTRFWHQHFLTRNIVGTRRERSDAARGPQEHWPTARKSHSAPRLANNRLAFVAVRVLTRFGDGVRCLVGQPVEIGTGIFAPTTNAETTFWGGYLSGPLP